MAKLMNAGVLEGVTSIGCGPTANSGVLASNSAYMVVCDSGAFFSITQDNSTAPTSSSFYLPADSVVYVKTTSEKNLLQCIQVVDSGTLWATEIS